MALARSVQAQNALEQPLFGREIRRFPPSLHEEDSYLLPPAGGDGPISLASQFCSSVRSALLERDHQEKVRAAPLMGSPTVQGSWHPGEQVSFH